MSGQDRVRWDEVYRENAVEGYPPPDPILYEYAPPVNADDEHRALDLAAGVGQNGLWLAEQGYVVDLLDISRIGLLRAQTEAGERGLRNINLLPVDFDDYELEANRYDLVCVFRYLKRDFFSQIRRSVRPGGRVIYVTFNRRYLDVVPGFNSAFLLEIGELAGYFADWKVVHNWEENHISRVVAIKPEE
jgi:tellurite methyltransferase